MVEPRGYLVYDPTGHVHWQVLRRGAADSLEVKRPGWSPIASKGSSCRVHPRLAGHGPTLFAGLSKWVDLKLVSRLAFGSGAAALRYEPGR